MKIKVDNKEKESRRGKINKIGDIIRRNVNNRSKIWEVKRRLTKKNTVTKQINYRLKRKDIAA